MRIETTNLKDSDYQCIFCGSTNIIREKQYQQNKFLFIKLNETLIKDEAFCNDCHKRAKFGKQIISKKTTEVKANGTTVEKIKDSYAYSKSNITKTTTITNSQLAIPKVQNRELYVTTLVTILHYLSRLDKSLNFSQHGLYLYLTDNFKDIVMNTNSKIESAGFSDELLLEEVKTLYTECEKQFSQGSTTQILVNSAQVLKGRILSDDKIKDFYFEIFPIANIKGLAKESFYQSLWY